MGRIIMVTGGARSGKSGFAEKLVKEMERDVLYIATSIPFDDEMKDRVKKHKERRPPNWVTHEGYKDLDEVIGKARQDIILVDCITIMVSNLLLESEIDWDNFTLEQVDELEKSIEEEVRKLLDSSNRGDKTVVIVTNELGMGLVPPYPMGRVYRDIAGRMNQLIAKKSDEVYLCVSGIPVKIK